MAGHKTKVCPWWWGFSLLLPFRKWFQGQDPHKILSPYINEGMTVLEPGPGMGYFTLPAARLVGPSGKVIAVDLQPRMLEGLRNRAQKAGLSDRIETRVVKSAADLGITDLQGKVDFILAFYMVHEVPEGARFFQDLFQAAKPGCRLLIAEPPLHVKKKDFEASLITAQNHGFKMAEPVHVPSSYSALLVKERP
jgi:ubiquinone/menaquinone biosynthesis C-methylase UbiE